jgi:hypothetical protein
VGRAEEWSHTWLGVVGGGGWCRLLFTEKLLMRVLLPLRCLRWILSWLVQGAFANSMRSTTWSDDHVWRALGRHQCNTAPSMLTSVILMLTSTQGKVTLTRENGVCNSGVDPSNDKEGDMGARAVMYMQPLAELWSSAEFIQHADLKQQECKRASILYTSPKPVQFERSYCPPSGCAWGSKYLPGGIPR